MTKRYGKFLRQIGKRHYSHLIKAMRITSKHYKDRNMLTYNEGGEYDDESHDYEYDDDNYEYEF